MAALITENKGGAELLLFCESAACTNFAGDMEKFTAENATAVKAEAFKKGWGVRNGFVRCPECTNRESRIPPADEGAMKIVVW